MCKYVYYNFVLFDNLLVYSMSEQVTSAAYRQLASSPKDEGTSSQPAPSGYSVVTEEGIFIFKAQSEEPFPPNKRGWFSRGAHERRKKMKKLQQQRAIARVLVHPSVNFVLYRVLYRTSYIRALKTR
ncbi:hypothetical protein Hanom_Chr17g01578691 [Helianthus anomalus]